MGIAASLRDMIMGRETIVIPRAEIVPRKASPVSFETVAPSPLITVTSNGIEVSVDLSQLLGATPIQLFRTQPYLRAVISFLARNVAQLGIGVFDRVSDTERTKETESVTARLLRRPNAYTTRYELIDSLVSDLALWDQAFWLVTPDPKRAEIGWKITPIPTAWVELPQGGTYFEPEYWRVTRPGTPTEEIPANHIVHFHGWNPEYLHRGVSPVETLKNILAEQVASVIYRQQRWEKGGRVGNVITRPAGAPLWSEQAEERFRQEWRNTYGGAKGLDAGGTPILQDGMTLTRVGFTAVEDEFVEANKLALTTVAAVYHVNPTMVGLLDNANYSNVREFRRMLYGDTLGPWLAMLEDRLNNFLVPLVEGDPETTIYVEFNINEKLQGSFEEQAAVANTAVGGPYMTRNEYRAKQNMPPIEGADELIVPLNVSTDGAPPATEALSATMRLSEPRSGTTVQRLTHVRARPSKRQQNRVQAVLERFYVRQASVVLSERGAKAKAPTAGWWDEDRWNDELTSDLLKVNKEINGEIGRDVTKRLGKQGFDPDANADLVESVSRSRAEWINQTTKDQLDAVDEADPDDYEDSEDMPTATGVFEEAKTNRSFDNAVTLCTTMAGIASKEAGRQAAPNGGATKTWQVNSSKSRHPEMDGETVGIEEKFSNGADWPGDAILGTDETAGCMCELIINIP
jgi:HK97 family phage portal protein